MKAVSQSASHSLVWYFRLRVQIQGWWPAELREWGQSGFNKRYKWLSENCKHIIYLQITNYWLSQKKNPFLFPLCSISRSCFAQVEESSSNEIVKKRKKNTSPKSKHELVTVLTEDPNRSHFGSGTQMCTRAGLAPWTKMICIAQINNVTH